MSVAVQHYTNMKMDGEYVATAKSGRKTMQKMINMENIEKGNILIAEFMGVPQGTHTHFMVEPFHLESYADAEDLKYDISWDWLMPVVEKCFDVTDDGDMEHIMHHLQVADKLNTYREVISFIENYNNKK